MANSEYLNSGELTCIELGHIKLQVASDSLSIPLKKIVYSVHCKHRIIQYVHSFFHRLQIEYIQVRVDIVQNITFTS